MNKQQALVEYVTFGTHKEQALTILLSDPEPVALTLTKVNLAQVLKKYQQGVIDADELTLWASFVDMRDEIDCSAVEDYIYALNNEELMAGINLSSVAKMLQLLANQPA